MAEEMGLKKIAHKMKIFAAANPRKSTADFKVEDYRVTLGGGLRIVYYADVSQRWHLSAYRLGVFPSSAEIAVLRRDFEIPMDAEETREKVPRKADPERQWHIVRLKWQETAEQKPLFEIGPVEPPVKYF